MNTDRSTEFTIMVNDQKFTIVESTITGSELKKKVGIDDVHNVYQKLSNGDMIEISNDIECDLTNVESPKFWVSKRNDSNFKFVIDGEEKEWQNEIITGYKLKILAGVDPTVFDLWQENERGEDERIENDQELNSEEIRKDCFFTVLSKTTAGEIPAGGILPRKDKSYLNDSNISFEEKYSEPNFGLILNSFELPKKKYKQRNANILILLPSGYPEIPPDMFYCNPWLKLCDTGNYPQCADVGFQFDGKNWQRWSRHNNQWRLGKDGIWTIIKRIEYSLEE